LYVAVEEEGRGILVVVQIIAEEIRETADLAILLFETVSRKRGSGAKTGVHNIGGRTSIAWKIRGTADLAILLFKAV
jgi:hypothetical protein